MTTPQTPETPAGQGGGIECRKCGCVDLRVTRTWRGPRFIRRTRVCRHCGTRNVTTEKIAGTPAG